LCAVELMRRHRPWFEEKNDELIRGHHESLHKKNA
jgi:hypothetical protein